MEIQVQVGLFYSDMWGSYGSNGAYALWNALPGLVNFLTSSVKCISFLIFYSSIDAGCRCLLVIVPLGPCSPNGFSLLNHQHHRQLYKTRGKTLFFIIEFVSMYICANL